MAAWAGPAAHQACSARGLRSTRRLDVQLDAFGRVWIRLDDLGAMNTRTGLDLATVVLQATAVQL